MIKKDNVFASAGKRSTDKTDADYRTGVIPNTIAMAEDVNEYGYISDRQLKVVCDEIVNALAAYNMTPNNDYTNGSTQIQELLTTKLQTSFMLTGINGSDYKIPTESTDKTGIVFPSMDVFFNQNVYYGNTASQMVKVTLSAQTLTPGGWTNGVHYIYATNNGGIDHQTEIVSGKDGATKCLLGSLFIVNGAYQAGSWKYQPWLRGTNFERREVPTGAHKGGFISPAGGLKVQMGQVQINAEGIGYTQDQFTPSVVDFPAANPFTYKFLHPKYDPSEAALSDLDVTHIFNITDGTWDVIPASYYGQYICMVPCIAPTGQTLMIPAMSTKTGSSYDNIYETAEEAIAAIFGLPYDLVYINPDNSRGGNVASRVTYLGQTLVCQIGLTDTNNPKQFQTSGVIPQALQGYTSASGSTGGSAGSYIPMTEKIWPAGTQALTAVNHAANVVTGNSNFLVDISFPVPYNGTLNQFEIKYVHSDSYQGLVFPTGTKWWGGAPEFVDGVVYNIIFEYINNEWRGGYLSGLI